MLAITKSWSRHGNFSGYEKILEYYPQDTSIIQPNKRLKIERINNFIKRNTRIYNYRPETFQQEIRAIFKSIIIPAPKIHILYGDMDFYYLHYLKQLKPSAKIVATFHHPPNELEMRLKYNRKKILGSIDKVIVMGRNQIPFFDDYVKDVHFIPHGININFFKPSFEMPAKKILIIGVSHRDNERNIQIIKRLHQIDKDFKVTIICPDEYKEVYNVVANVTFLSHFIKDEDLLEFYHTHICVLLSLKDCTASNTLLEALATGCPLVINKIGGTTDYITDNTIPIFENSQIEDSVQYILKLYNDRDFFLQKKDNQVQLSYKYSWKNVARETLNYINS